MTTKVPAVMTDEGLTAAGVAAAVLAGNVKLAGDIVQRVNTQTGALATGTTSATTFKVRAGPITAGTITVNGASGGRYYGGVYASSITVTEIKA